MTKKVLCGEGQIIGNHERRQESPPVAKTCRLPCDRRVDGRPFRILTVVDRHTREAFSLIPRANLRASQVTEALDALVRRRGSRGATGGQRPGDDREGPALIGPYALVRVQS